MNIGPGGSGGLTQRLLHSQFRLGAVIPLNAPDAAHEYWPGWGGTFLYWGQ
jgi:hypothetical protein